MRNVQSPEGSPEQGLQVFSLAEVEALVEQGYTAIPLVEKLELRETAGALYDRLRGNGPSFLLESADPAEHQGRYSFIGVEQESVIRLEAGKMMVDGVAHAFDDPYDFVDQRIAKRVVAPVADLPPFFGGAVGLFGYDLARYREPTIGEAKDDGLHLPEMSLMVPKVTIAQDGYRGETSIISTMVVEPDADRANVAESYRSAVDAIRAMKQRIVTPTESGPVARPVYEALEFSPNLDDEAFKAAVRTVKDHAEAGDIFQAVPSRRFSSRQTVDDDFAHEVFDRLKRLNPSRYAFLLEFGDFQVAGCSPETLVRVTGDQVMHMAIAGTRKRGESAEADAALARELEMDPKERAEHNMLVDLCRNDMNRVCDPDSVAVETHAAVENYSHVMHLTSKVHGTLDDDMSALDALASIMPAGTLSGAPKISAMQLVDGLEPDKRGFYGGAVGYVTPGGNLDSCIFIRSIVVDKEGRVHVQAGAGVVADSDPQSELEETVIKARAPMRAIEEVCTPSVEPQRLLETKEQPAERSSRTRQRIGKKVLLLDNYDSYTYNVRQYLANLGAEVVVMRNDVSQRELIGVEPDFLVVSPGPHTPREAGQSVQAMRYFPEQGVPSLGICLGHQALAVAFGGEVGRHKAVHGKSSTIEHDGRTIFEGLGKRLEVMRYHSLVARTPLPDTLERSAFTIDDGEEVVMAIRHKELPAEGVQFHPESFYTPYGNKILENFLEGAHE